VQFVHSEEQQLIRDSARELLAAHATPAQVRATLQQPLGYDPELWRQMSSELGWVGLALPTSCGGAGLGWVELCLLQEELGRRLVASPFFGTAALAAPLVQALASEAQQRVLLSRIASGKVRIACVLGGADGRPPPEGVSVELRAGRGGARLQGVGDFVIHGDAADLLLVLTRAPAGLRVAVIAATAAGVRVQPRVMLDLTRPLARVEFTDVAVTAEELLGGEGAEQGIEQGLQRARIALAAEALGGAERLLQMTTDYVRERVQFGRPIGSFQAVKHRLADMMVQVEAAKSAAWYAACVADECPAQLAEAAAIAKSTCCDAFFDCAANAIQLHGGIGFTWEHEAHLYFKRARASAVLLGSPAWQRERLTRLIGGGAAATPLF
jgi:alkylation response protein AidB-like acyl-CoA dehydrogenase